jgi:hypothetical protein
LRVAVDWPGQNRFLPAAQKRRSKSTGSQAGVEKPVKSISTGSTREPGVDSTNEDGAKQFGLPVEQVRELMTGETDKFGLPDLIIIARKTGVAAGGQPLSKKFTTPAFPDLPVNLMF